MLTGTISGVPGAVRAIANVERQTQGAVAKGMALGVKQGEGIVKGHARGRPGPRAVTGDFNRSIVGDFEVGAGVVFGQIGTNSAQGRRLEYGFVGADVLGRVYNQPPYSYLQPSVPAVTKAVETHIAAQIKGSLAA